MQLDENEQEIAHWQCGPLGLLGIIEDDAHLMVQPHRGGDVSGPARGVGENLQVYSGDSEGSIYIFEAIETWREARECIFKLALA